MCTREWENVNNKGSMLIKIRTFSEGITILEQILHFVPGTGCIN